MKAFLLFIVLFAFLQSAVLTLNLVLVILIARSLVLDDGENLISAFFGGLILSLLTQTNLGYWPLVLILTVKLGQLLKSLPVSFNPIMIFIAGAVQILMVVLLNKFFINERIEIYPHIIEAVLVLPAYFLIRIWEERFVAKSTIKLRI